VSNASVALLVFAVAPHALGGVRLRCGAGPEREQWLRALRALLPQALPWQHLPLHGSDDALLGGLDLAATLATGKPVAERGLLARAQGGIVVAAMAERLTAGRAARLAAALDDAQLAIVALDEGIDDDEQPPPSLLDRLALWVLPEREAPPADAEGVARARAQWRQVAADDATVGALVAAAAALGVASSRAQWQALCVARIAAALAGRNAVLAEDAALAARLVLAPRATRLPPPPAEAEPPPPPDAHDAATPPPDHADDEHSTADEPLDERVLAAAQAAIPPGLLALLAAGRPGGARRGEAGRVGELARSRQRGRVVGTLRGSPRDGARLALIETLRAAAPWQALRRAAAAASFRDEPSTPGRAEPRSTVRAEHHTTVGAELVEATAPGLRPAQPERMVAATRVHVHTDDLRIQRRVQRRGTTTIFAIDASGSQALHRLAEAKGAVELLLADCYARRDRVAVIGFRGAGAQVLLAPTRSLVRARRQLAGLPGGGGTPLAAGIDAAHGLVLATRRGGSTPLVVLLTDGKANIGRDGAPGREAAQRDALQAARALRAAAVATLLIDTSPQPCAAAQALAAELGARCVALPHAQAQTLSSAVRIERGRD